MTTEELEKLFLAEFMESHKDGSARLKGSVSETITWIAKTFHVLDQPKELFSKAFTGMHDKHGKPIHEGDHVKLYYKGEYVICKVIYDAKHAAFFIKWPDGYVNQYFMNGSSYEIVNSEKK